MPVAQLKNYLDREGVRYVTLDHSKAFTAQEIAASAHVAGKAMAKVVIVNIDGRMAMAVLPANDHVDLDQLREASGASSVELATEQEFRSRFPDCEVGAMPPFGNLYDMDVFVEENLRTDGDIVFNAGNHTELIRMSYRDFERLVEPKVLSYSTVAY